MSAHEVTLINGQEFTRYEERFWSKNNVLGDVNVGDTPDVVCHCGNQTFTLRYGDYEIKARCSACGTEEVVYSG